MRSPPSRADRQLIEQLRQVHGVGVSTAQLERWRQHGLLARAVRSFAGDGGSTSTLPPGSVEQARFLARRSRRGQPWQALALQALQAGRDVEPEAVGRALRWAAGTVTDQTAAWTNCYLDHVTDELDDDESTEDYDVIITVTEAVSRAAAALAGKKLGLTPLVSRALPHLSGEDLAREVRWHHEALMQAGSGLELDAATRARAVTALGMPANYPDVDEALRLLAVMATPGFVTAVAADLTAAEAVAGCREAQSWCAEARERGEPVNLLNLPPERFGAVAVLAAWHLRLNPRPG